MRCNVTRGLHAGLEMALAALQRAPATPEKKQSKAPKRWWMLPNFSWESMLQMRMQDMIGGTAYHHAIKIPTKCVGRGGAYTDMFWRMIDLLVSPSWSNSCAHQVWPFALVQGGRLL